jgi:hypothetical protein
MSITWEQARVLCSYGLTEDDVLKVTNTMRARGVRRENAFKNIGMFDAHHKIKFGLASTQLNVALSLSLSGCWVSIQARRSLRSTSSN